MQSIAVLIPSNQGWFFFARLSEEITRNIVLIPSNQGWFFFCERDIHYENECVGAGVPDFLFIHASFLKKFIWIVKEQDTISSRIANEITTPQAKYGCLVYPEPLSEKYRRAARPDSVGKNNDSSPVSASLFHLP